MKKIKRILLTIFLVCVIIGVTGVGFAITYYNKGIGPTSDESQEVYVTIQNGETATNVLYTLHREGLLKNIFCGRVYLKLNEVGNLQANSYILNKNMSLKEIFAVMTNPTDEYILQTKVQIIEGETISSIAKTIAAVTKRDENDVLNQINDKEFLNQLIDEYWFITEDILKEGINQPLEGYLYPETYLFNTNVTTEEIIRTTLDMMDKKLTPFKDSIEKMGWSVHQFLTFAAIVEREALFDEDRPKIAGVLMNRLDINMPLQVDCTVNYAWDRTGVDVTYSHLEIDSPYNTYKYKGLPIGPISTVSEITISACAEYEENDYLYFFAKQDGTLIYSKTLSEHNSAVQKFKWY